VLHAFVGANSITVNELNISIEEYKQKVSSLEKQIQLQRKEIEQELHIKVDEENRIHIEEVEKVIQIYT
jgi:response regulator of citrate/malate metabolism